MSAKSLQYITLAVACVALVVAILGWTFPVNETADPEPSVTALIVGKTDAYVTVSVDSEKDGTLEVWCGNEFAGSITYSVGNHVYTKQMNNTIASLPMSSLTIRYR